MASLTIAQLLTLLDKTHEQVEEMWSVCGTKDAGVVYADRPSSEYNKIMEAIFEEKDYISDPSGNSLSDGQIRELIALYDRAWELWPYTKFARMQLLQFMRIVDMHLRDYGDYGINSKLKANAERVGYWLHATDFPLDPANVFPPGYETTTADDGTNHGATWNTAPLKMGQFECTNGGTSTWVYTAGADIDVTKYGKSNLFLYCDNGFSASSHVFNVTCKLIDDTTAVRSCTIPMATGSMGDIGTHGTDMFIGTTNMLYFSGTSATGDIVSCMSEVERFTKIT